MWMKFKSLLNNLRWPAGCLIFLLYSCQHVESSALLQPLKEDPAAKGPFISRALSNISLAEKLVHNGDIITRTGNDFTSQSLKTLNRRNKTYSHCGIASIENDSVFVYHALGGEWNPDQKIRRDAFVNFAEPYNNNQIGIFRFKIDVRHLKNLVDVAKAYYNKGVTFDMDFDLKTDDKMYCAEFVYKSLVKASGGKLVFMLSHINHFEFIGVDDIFLHPLCQKQYELAYK